MLNLGLFLNQFDKAFSLHVELLLQNVELDEMALCLDADFLLILFDGLLVALGDKAWELSDGLPLAGLHGLSVFHLSIDHASHLGLESFIFLQYELQSVQVVDFLEKAL